MRRGVDAEEAGLVGSNHFCQQPLVPMASVSAMLNLDMIGRDEESATWNIKAAASGKPRGLTWKQCEFHDDALLAYDRTSGEIYALRGATIEFEAFFKTVVGWL